MIYKAILLPINQCPEHYKNEAKALFYKTFRHPGCNPVDLALISMPWQCLNCGVEKILITITHPTNGYTSWRPGCGCNYESYVWAWQTYFEHDRELK